MFCQDRAGNTGRMRLSKESERSQSQKGSKGVRESCVCLFLCMCVKHLLECSFKTTVCTSVYLPYAYY